ncbi:trehalose-6-phosphate synthase [Moraxella osloensis]|uniref:Trehalose-6-phosphate synthase n=1 Tax=Faucicola osloensis TaxID=34062 RepID=A0AAD0EX89_FAUOS|nr:trehalose-6-phosphate synthase [Moraxella osloensis]ATQ83091.1 trehalose-6-phosphate synthase [Moraxella osloensis]ATW85587.1 trehalose-6-phosphate synthase [Moraxella osloensis]
MSKLIVLSNRVNLPNKQSPKAVAGGLAVALQEALAKDGGIWVGWNGQVVTNISDMPDTVNQFATEQHDKVTYVTTAFSPMQYEKYYCGYANNRLWAGMHDRTDLIVSSSEDFSVYQAVNRMFAKQLQQIAQPDDMIWIQDYHFFAIARHCRDLGMKQRIGFFLHIPFPQLWVWDFLTYGQTLINQLLDYDVVGLQTQQDAQNCVAVIEKLLPHAIQITQTNARTLIAHGNHITLIQAYPIGINPVYIHKLASQPLSDQAVLKNLTSTITTILAVERLDYTKGIPERLQAFAAFLQRYPQYLERIQLYQIACPSRLDIQTYQQLRQQVHTLVEQINSQFATASWQPIIYQEDPVSHDNLMPLFRQCQICWVNSLKDGMNLVAKEYIAAQDEQNAGILILSKNAGAAHQLQQAILVDPNSNDSMIEGLYQALTMTKQQREQRHQSLLKSIYETDIDTWRAHFLADLTHMEKTP